LTVIKKGARSQERLVAQNAVNTAKANMDNAEVTYKRYKTLHDRGAVSSQQFDTYATQYEVAKAQYDSAVQQLSLIREGARPEDIEAAEGQVSEAREALRMAKANASQVAVRWEDVKGARAAVEQAQAALSAAKQQEDYTIIKTTVSGVVASRTVDPGQTASAGGQLMRIVDLHTVYFEANLSEKDFVQVKVGQPVVVEVDALPGKQFVGHVAKVLPTASVLSRNFRVRIEIPNTAGDLRPGMFARGNVKVGVQKAALLAPKDALTERHGDTMVFSLEGKKAKMHVVQVGIVNTHVAEILEPTDLKVGQKVVTSGRESLQEGSAVYLAEGSK
jgi:RND family efflux transporter MFP subunit